MSKQPNNRLLLIWLVLTAFGLFSHWSVLAADETPSDLINTVNGLRASLGMPPYEVDPWLMAYAQQHADYMAANQISTHVHQDGSGPWDYGIQENVATGTDGLVTVAVVVYEIWVDWGHRHIMTDYATGQIGAGLAVSANGYVYYALNIRPGEETSSSTDPGGSKDELSAALLVSPTVRFLATSTPGPNGIISHLVKEGETLWTIAISYGVTIDELRLLNGLPVDSNVISIGQTLLVRPAGTFFSLPAEPLTAVLEVSPTASSPQRTAESPPTAILETVAELSTSPSATVTPTPRADETPPSLQPRDLLMVLILGLLGLLVISLFGSKKS
jgi:LysM repeat protein